MLSTTYGNGGSTTSTDSYQVGTPNVHGFNLSGVARAIMAKKEADSARQRQQASANQAQVQALTPAGETNDVYGKGMRRANLINTQSTLGPAPSHYVTVAGQTFLTPDDMAMNAAQRQAYLPQSAGLNGSRTPEEDARAQRLFNDSNKEETPGVQSVERGGGQLDQEALRILQMQALMGRG